MYYLIKGEIINYTKHYEILITTSALVKNVRLDIAKLNVYKTVLQEVCQNLLKSLLEIKLKRSVVMKSYQWNR